MFGFKVGFTACFGGLGWRALGGRWLWALVAGEVVVEFVDVIFLVVQVSPFWQGCFFH